ncbi:hypothetical protein E5843_13360 [Luteimonas yindakuii]|uniref:hypothetical protein n=1 Tax=Luteimonas yindakuii TaxID=2565782 RepID=UPI0010A42D38|nr:hypothetical protein [Luteimonas yindakuii]QCO68505.1 hypothetical protein E5843_13360 [Luteimonas yindakuii]
MRLLVLIAALAMPVVAWFSVQGVFGPDQSEISSRYPLLVQPAGYAFSIWSLIFLLDVGYALRQATGPRKRDRLLARIAPATALGFACTAVWMPVYSREWLWLCVLLILVALGTLLWAAWTAHRGKADLWTRTALGMHAGWLSIAAVLNLAQALLGAGVLPADNQLGWSFGLLALAILLAFAANAALRGAYSYAAAAAWGFLGVTVALARGSEAPVLGWTALALAIALLVQTAWLRRRRRGRGSGFSR